VVCKVEADLSAVHRSIEFNARTGMPYYTMSFDIVLLFGLTELKAQVAYLENVSGSEMASRCVQTDQLSLHSTSIVQGVERR